VVVFLAPFILFLLNPRALQFCVVSSKSGPLVVDPVSVVSSSFSSSSLKMSKTQIENIRPESKKVLKTKIKTVYSP